MCIGMANGGKSPKEMTDEEIIKGLNLHLGKAIGTGYTKLHHNEISNLIDLINRQQFQLDNYSHNVRTMVRSIQENQNLINELCGVCKTMKAKVVKDLEAKIYEKLHEAEMHGNFEPTLTREMLDSIFKEMVGDDK